jgi:iron complex outermembrane receptor protein
MWKPARGALLYLNYAEALEPGGTAPAGTTNANQALPPIRSEQVELGAKLERGELTLTAALFDLRKPLEVVDAATQTFVQNGQQRHRGIELTATGRATRDLTIVAGTMLLDATTRNTGDPGSEGKRPGGVPRFTANLWGDLRIAAGLYVNAGVFHAGRQFLDGTNTQEVPRWTRLDIGARYETRLAGARATLRFGIENVADKSYWASAHTGILTIADPRTLKASATFDL